MVKAPIFFSVIRGGAPLAGALPAGRKGGIIGNGQDDKGWLGWE
jgi:hypothetical protein